MDEAAFQIDPASQIIPVHANHSPVKITFLKKGFTNGNGQYQFGDYLLPLRITAVDKNNIHPDKSLQYVPVSFRPVLLDRSNWEIVELNSCICDEPSTHNMTVAPKSFWKETQKPIGALNGMHRCLCLIILFST